MIHYHPLYLQHQLCLKQHHQLQQHLQSYQDIMIAYLTLVNIIHVHYLVLMVAILWSAGVEITMDNVVMIAVLVFIIVLRLFILVQVKLECQ